MIKGGCSNRRNLYIYQKANQRALRQTFNKDANINNVFNANVGDVIFDSDNNKYEVVERKKKERNKFKMINKAPRFVADKRDRVRLQVKR